MRGIYISGLEIPEYGITITIDKDGNVYPEYCHYIIGHARTISLDKPEDCKKDTEQED